MSIKKFFIFLKVLSGVNFRRGHILVYNKIAYTHIAFGIYIRRFFSLTFKLVHEISFKNNKNIVMKLHILDKKKLHKYENLPGHSLTKKLIWKR
jgi:hypothetical protein